MQGVKFLLTTFEGKQEQMGFAILVGKRVNFVGLSEVLVEELKRGISNGKVRYKPKDGIKFLRGLKYAFTGSLVRATDVLEV